MPSRMTKDELISKLDQLIQCSVRFISDDTFVYCNEAIRIQANSKRQGGIYIDDVQTMIGHLKQFRSAIRYGLLKDANATLSASDFDDFLEHAQEYHRLNRKVESSVIASAVLEDSIKRIIRTRGLTPSRNLEEALNALKAAGVFSANETKKLKYFAGIRNAALHADWEEFDLADVGNLISGVRDIIAAHIRSSTCI